MIERGLELPLDEARGNPETLGDRGLGLALDARGKQNRTTSRR
jgi:hypothetical protein